ncbi:MAG: mechanosensitive ion channel [Alphaproteobacteria bacterium]|nr:mechanosensitive ion channel [Alphaproteobacteria bacterium]MCB9930692.1 mechanosensitive ion channel [Alphaproteobacteria bacterium]
MCAHHARHVVPRMLAAICLLGLLLAGAIAIGGASPALAQGVPGATAPAAPAAPASNLSADQAKALSQLLNDPASREAIVKELDRIAATAEAAKAGTGGATAAASAAADDDSIGRQIAETTRAVAKQAVDRSVAFMQQLQRAPDAVDAVANVPAEVVWQALVDLLLVMVTTIVLFLALRTLAKRLYRRMGALAASAGIARTGALILGSVVIDALVVLLAWAAGYLAALLVFGEPGEIGIRQTLYLNAFLVVELAKVVMRGVLSPTSSALRLVAIPDKGARLLSVWLNIAISLVGYGQLLIVPIINENVSFFAGRGVSTVLSLFAVAILIVLVIGNRSAVTQWLLGERSWEQRSGVIRFLARNWHVPVLLYLIGLFAIVLARPGGILIPLLVASAKVFGLVVAGVVLNTLLRRLMRRGVRLPPSVHSRLPLLEQRLNGFVPHALIFVRVVITAAILAFSLQLIGFLDFDAWLNSPFGVRFTGTLVSVALIAFGAFLVWLALSSWVEYRLNPDYGSVPTSRERTLLSLLRNAATILLLVITLMFVLSEMGIDIAPLIASAGVFGLAIGFGAQKLVQDIITGVFIQFENAINVGDVVSVGGTTGVVERLTIRSVSLRDLQGIYHIIPFSSVDMVSNYMRGFTFYVCDMGIAYRESVDEAKQAMFDAFAELRANPDYGKDILEDLQWQGLHAFGDSAIILRVRIKCVGGRHLVVGRAYNEILKRVFDERDIEIPFPHQTVYFGIDKKGNAPPLHVVRDRRPDASPGKPEPQPHAEPEPETIREGEGPAPSV